MSHFHCDDMLRNILLLLITHLCANAQQTKLVPDTFTASWIAAAQAKANSYGVFHFRKVVHLSDQPARFVVRLSADNRYQLYVNNVAVVCGPQRSDLAHWRYDTLDLAPYLKKGKNIIAATVWNQGQYAAWAQLSLQTGFWLDGKGAASVANTDSSWTVMENFAYVPVANGLHIIGPFEQIYAQRVPWGWTEENYDDRNWTNAIKTEDARAFGKGITGGRQMQERNVPLPEESSQRFNSIRRAIGIPIDPDFLKGKKPLQIPPHGNVTLLLDQGTLTTAYPELLLSGGAGCKITLTYAEALYSDKNGQKGNRNEVEGKSIKGNQDVYILDGGANRFFRPLYYRTFRYVELKIENHEFPLSIHDLKSSFTAYPFVERARFSSSDTTLKKIWDTGWRTSRLCAYETYMDCPYYEQLQYLGDTRIQALVSIYVSGDDRLMKNAISQFDQSGIDEGLTQSRYPSNMKQVIPPFSLFWIGMLHDYHMLGKDEQFVKGFLPGVARILAWHQQYVNEKGMLSRMPYWNFVDWPKEWPWKGDENISGIPASALRGNSAVLTLQYAYALNYAAKLYRSLGGVKEAERYAKQAQELNRSTYAACWDTEKGMMADSPEKDEFSQHTNAMAVLSGAIPAKDQKQLLLEIEKNPGIIECTIYYRFYLVQAFKKAGLADQYLRLLKPWYTMLDLGLSTFAERPEPTRSDCHAWSASPVYDLLATVCGISPLKPGFKTIRIAPEMGSLTWIDAAMPHPQGEIKVALKREMGRLTGMVTLPKETEGEFVWEGYTMKLKPGMQRINIKDI